MEHIELIETSKNGEEQRVVVPKKDIRYIQSIGNKFEFHMKNGKIYSFAHTLKSLELLFPELNGYVRVDRMYIVNVDEITYYDEVDNQIYFDKEVVMKKNFITTSPSGKLRLEKIMRKD